MQKVRRSIKKKLLMYFISLILIPIALIAIISWRISTDSLEKQMTEYTKEVLTQVNQNINFYVQDMEDIIWMLSRNKEVIQYLRQPTSYEHEKVIKEELEKYKTIHPEIAGMMIVSRDEGYVSNDMIHLTRDPLNEEFWFLEAKEDGQVIHLFSQPMGRNIKGISNYSADQVVSISKAITDPETKEFLGVVLLDLKTEIIQEVINNVTFGKKGFVYVEDKDGRMVYAPVNPIVYRIKSNWLSGDNREGLEKVILGNRYQILYTTSAYTSWQIVGVFSLDEALISVIKIRNLTVMISIIVLLVATTVAVFFATSIAKPLRHLQDLMKRAEEGDLTVRCDFERKDELGSLGGSFNTMIKEIDQLVKMVYREQKSKREAELKMLQSQINPHFLYNTLDTIQWMALENGVTEIVHIIESLTKLFRIGLSKGKEMITLEQEIQHVASYLAIQQVRYADKLDYSMVVPNDLLHLMVPKLILQPMVENSIYHGIKEKRGKGHIEIIVDQVKDQLHITVKDDGRGILKEDLTRIQDNLRRNTGENKVGYGMFNVNERIRLLYGEEYGVYIDSTIGMGTCVKVILPAQDRGGEKDV